MAARVVQAERVNKEKIKAPLKEDKAAAYEAAKNAEMDAAAAMQNGEREDVVAGNGRMAGLQEASLHTKGKSPFLLSLPDAYDV